MNRLEYLVTDPAVREVSPFAIHWEMQIRELSFQERRGEKGVYLYRPGSVILEELSPSGVICFNSCKSLFSGHQLVYRSS